MLQISAQQLAELLNGIARAQAAVLQGLEVANPGTRSNYVVPSIQNAAHLRDHPEPTLTDLPVRILLSNMGRVGPDIAIDYGPAKLKHVTREEWEAQARKLSAPIIDDWIKKASAKGVNARAILDEFHAELKKVAAGK